MAIRETKKSTSDKDLNKSPPASDFKGNGGSKPSGKRGAQGGEKSTTPKS